MAGVEPLGDGRVADDPAADVSPVDRGFGAALARVLDHLCATAPRSAAVSRFDAVRPPPLSLAAYVDRLERYFDCSQESLVLSLVYIDRVVKQHPKFPISLHSIHRLLLSSLLLAVKFFDDQWYPNSHYAKVGGVQLRELNQLEVELLRLLQWNLYVPAAEFELYHSSVVQAGAQADLKEAAETEERMEESKPMSDGETAPGTSPSDSESESDASWTELYPEISDSESDASADTAPLVGPQTCRAASRPAGLQPDLGPHEVAAQ